MGLFLLICGALGWITVVMTGLGWALTSAIEGAGWRVPVLRFAALIIFVAGTVAVAEAMFDANDPNANRLCVSGHERWFTELTRGGSYEVKRWVCVQWESR